MTRGIYRIQDGRAPAASGEAAVTPALASRLHLHVERQREVDILPTGVFRGFPAFFARNRFQPVQEARGDCRRASGLRGMAEDHVRIAKQLREIMRR